MEAIIGFFTHIIGEIVIVALVALATFFLGRYYVTPKRCQNQKDECWAIRNENLQKIAQQSKEYSNQFGIEAEKIHNRINNTSDSFIKKTDDVANKSDVLKKLTEFSERLDRVYVRRDAVLPQLKIIQDEIVELRKVIYRYVKFNGKNGD